MMLSRGQGGFTLVAGWLVVAWYRSALNPLVIHWYPSTVKRNYRRRLWPRRLRKAT